MFIKHFQKFPPSLSILLSIYFKQIHIHKQNKNWGHTHKITAILSYHPPPPPTHLNFTLLFLSFTAHSPIPPLLPSSPQLPLPLNSPLHLDLVITVTSTGFFLC